MTDLLTPLALDAAARDFEPTLQAALARIDAIRPGVYARTRNHLDGAVTRLSPYLTHGFVDVPQVVERLSQRVALSADDKIVFELAWREYFHHLWHHWREGIFEPRRPPPASGYAAAVPDDVRAARTGVPVIDGAVRTLYDTGYLHNHARMWLASYVVHLRKTHWRAGADWMYRHLLDGDLASNTLSWQWVAGTLTGKPYLFNAENVARYAPDLASPGTVIDAGYEVLDRIARQSPDCGSEPGYAPGVVEPAPGVVPDPDIWGLRDDRRECWIMHPWALGAPPQGRVIGWLEPSFHARFPWSEKRWSFVLTRMRAACDGIVVGDARALRERLGEVRLASMQTLNPGYAEAMRAAGVLCEPVARQFDDPPQPMPSFTRFWQTVAPQVATTQPWHH